MRQHPLGVRTAFRALLVRGDRLKSRHRERDERGHNGSEEYGRCDQAGQSVAPAR